MKKLLCLILALILLAGCAAPKPNPPVTEPTPGVTAPTQTVPATDPTEGIVPPVTTPPTPTEATETDPTEPEGTVPNPTEPKPTEPKPTEPKPTEPKPTEPKPTEPKPTEPKPTEPKPTEPKPTEPKPTEPKPTEPKPTEPKPTEPKPTEPKPTEPKPTEPKPTEPKPTEPKPTEPKPTEPKPTEPPITEPPVTEPWPIDPPTSTGSLTVHCIDVGQADCALLECNGEYIIIDGGNVADSSLVVSYLLAQGVEELEAVVGTHAHEDHIGGLAGVLAKFPTSSVYCPTRSYTTTAFNNFAKYTQQQGLQITVPKPGDVIEFGGATATVLGPVKSAYDDPNDTSIVLMVEYGQTRFLFTGDMETTAENDMLDYWGEGFDWSADVLKVGHHGSYTSTGYRFLNEVMPTYGVICVGKDNSYGHPHDAPLSRLRDADVTVLRTDQLGTIVITSDGRDVTLQDVVPPEPEKPADPDGDGYVTIAEAIALCQKTGTTATPVSYYVRGTIVSIDNTTYGNMTIKDATGTLFIYGCYSADGSTRYDAMKNRPKVGDEVLLCGSLLNYGGYKPEMKNARLMELVRGS